MKNRVGGVFTCPSVDPGPLAESGKCIGGISCGRHSLRNFLSGLLCVAVLDSEISVALSIQAWLAVGEGIVYCILTCRDI